MRTKLSLALAVLITVFSLGFIGPNVGATDLNWDTGKTNVQSGGGGLITTDPGTNSVGSLVTKGLNILMYAVAVISVVMIIFGGIRYATSGGNAEKVKSAKNTILYAVVGLAVALLALVIVKFVETTAGEVVYITAPVAQV